MARRPRWVLDTNVLASALLWQGTPGRLIELAGEHDVRLLSSQTLLDELAATLAKPKLGRHVRATGLSAAQMLVLVRRLTTRVTPTSLPYPISRDADDDHVLACALAAKADLVVTGDDDLLSLGAYQGIAIVSPALALRTLVSTRRSD
jgi:uncharacterized protein